MEVACGRVALLLSVGEMPGLLLGQRGVEVLHEGVSVLNGQTHVPKLMPENVVVPALSATA